jgi:hypothetical protein
MTIRLAALLLLAWAATPPTAGAGGWERVSPGGDTGCGTGAPFSFFVRKAGRSDLLVFFQGGGACWSSQTCDLAGSPTWDPTADASDLAENQQGILDLANPANPFRDYSVVFVPYCTGDVHLGARRERYVGIDEADAVRITEIEHRGRANAMAALRWAFEARPKVRRAFVTGESAGGVASAHYAGVVAEHYPGARVAQLADSSGAFRARAVPDLMDTWGASAGLRELPGFDGRDLDFEALYLASASRSPQVSWAQVNRADDGVQAFFVSLVGRSDPTRALLAEAQAVLRGGLASFRTYLAPGTAHTILSTPAFYSEVVEGVRLRDWVAALASGSPADDVRCPECAR